MPRLTCASWSNVLLLQAAGRRTHTRHITITIRIATLLVKVISTTVVIEGYGTVLC